MEIRAAWIGLQAGSDLCPMLRFDREVESIRSKVLRNRHNDFERLQVDSLFWESVWSFGTCGISLQ
jgi:hypothetical protein